MDSLKSILGRLKQSKKFFLFAAAGLTALLILGLLLFFFKPDLLKKITTINKPFEIANTSPVNFQNNFPVLGRQIIVFSKPLNIQENQLEKYISVSPRPKNTRWRMEKNKQVVYLESTLRSNNLAPTFDYNTLYTVKVKKEILSFRGERLESDYLIQFRTQQNPEFGVMPLLKVISSQPNKEIEISLQSLPSAVNTPLNPNRFTLTVYKSDKEALLNFLRRKKTSSVYSSYIYASPENLGQRVLTTEATIENGRVIYTAAGASNGASLKVPPLADKGVYYVRISNDFGADDLFITNSSMVTQTVSDNGSLLVKTSQADSGYPIAPVNVGLYSLEKETKVLSSAKTNSLGIADIPHRQNNVVDLVVSEGSGEFNVTDAFGRGGFLNQSPMVFSTSDRAIYKPGDTVRYKAVLRTLVNGRLDLPKGDYYLRLNIADSASDGEYKKFTVDEYGTIAADFKIPDWGRQNYANVELAVKNNDEYSIVDYLFFDIQSYRKPDLDFSLEVSQKEFISKDKIKAVVTGKTLYGTAFSNQEFTYRVLANPYTEVLDKKYDYWSTGGSYGQGKDFFSGSGKLDAQGRAEIEFSSDLTGFEESQILTVEITPKVNITPSIVNTPLLVHRGQFGLFLDQIKSDTTSGISGVIQISDHSSPRIPVTGKEVTISLYPESYSGESGTSPITQTKVTSNSLGRAEFKIDYKTKGSYKIQFQAKDSIDNTVTYTTSLYLDQPFVQDNIDPAVEYDLSIKEISSNSATVELVTKADIKNVLVVAAVENNIITQKQFNLSSPQEQIRLDLPDITASPVIYVFSVADGKAYSSQKQTSLNISNIAKENTLKVDVLFTPQDAKPGQTVKAEITTLDSSNNPVSADSSMAVVDSAVSQISARSSNIVSDFYSSSSYSSLSIGDSSRGVDNNTIFGGLGGGCFLAGTKILMADGSLKNIEDVTIGDKILTRRSDYSNNLTVDAVTKTFVHKVAGYLVINNRLKVTPEHRLFISGEWKTAKEAKVGDVLLDSSGQQVEISSISEMSGRFTVYNLTVENTHTFFADNFYVHNSKGGNSGSRSNFLDTAFWKANIRTNSSGKAVVEFKLPDNITTYDVDLYTNTTTSKFGQSNSKLVVKKDYVLISGLAPFYVQDDKPLLPVVFQNTTQKPFSGKITLLSPQINYNQSQQVDVGPGEVREVNFPVQINTKENFIDFTVDASDSENKSVDRITQKRSVLPKGNIKASWISKEGADKINLKSQFGNLDANIAHMTIYHHPGLMIRNVDSDYLFYPSADYGQDFYINSKIVSLVQSKKLDPSLFDYANLLNNLRVKVAQSLQEAVLENNSGQNSLATDSAGVQQTNSSRLWSYNEYTLPEEIMVSDLWLVKGLESVKDLKIFDDLPEDKIGMMLKKASIKDQSYPQKPEVNVLRDWIFSEDNLNSDGVEAQAIKVLKGRASTKSLISKRTKTSPDRYVWSRNKDYENLSVFLPALAVIENGDIDEANKAMLGVVASLRYSSEFSALLGFIHLSRLNLNPEPISYSVDVNNIRYLTIDNSGSNKYLDPIETVSVPVRGQLSININYNQKIPLYWSLSQFDYQSQGYTNPLKNSAVILQGGLSRSREDIRVSSGEGSNVALTVLKADTRQFAGTFNSVILVDALEPNMAYLDQMSGNSPQLSELIRTKISEKEQSLFYPSDYSSEAVFFVSDYLSGYDTDQLIFNYATYNIGGGEYHRPKTEVVLPDLGVIITEK